MGAMSFFFNSDALSDLYNTLFPQINLTLCYKSKEITEELTPQTMTSKEEITPDENLTFIFLSSDTRYLKGNTTPRFAYMHTNAHTLAVTHLHPLKS